MTGSFEGEVRPSREGETNNRLRDWAVGVLVVEVVAVAIAIVSPLTPSKTGSTWSPAHLFSEDPTYLEKVAASFVLVNALILVLGLVALVVSRWGSARGD